MFTELVAMRILLNSVLPSIAEKHGISAERFSEIIAEVRQYKHETARQLLELYARTDGQAQATASR